MRYITFVVTSKPLGTASSRAVSRPGSAMGQIQNSSARALASVGYVQIAPVRTPAKRLLQTIQQSQDTILKYFAYISI